MAVSKLTKSVGGSYVNTVEVVTQYLPGNFGVRVIEALPSTNLSDVWRERLTTQTNLACLEPPNVPKLMEAPEKVDYPTDDDSDDGGAAFSIKIPDLSDLINEFEKDDDTLYKAAE